MPELPEVETVRRGLERIFAVDNVIAKIELKRPDLRVPIPAGLPALLRQQPIVAVRRRAKYLRADVFKNRWLKHLGIEPFAQEFDAGFMLSHAVGKAVPVKNFLMDQKIVVGIGNIYASEALFLAGIRPLRQAQRVKPTEWRTLIKHVRAILQTSINKGGTTLRDHRMVDGELGDFQNSLRVYDREGQPCRKCKKPIRMKTLAGRSTYWCNNCQK